LLTERRGKMRKRGESGGGQREEEERRARVLEREDKERGITWWRASVVEDQGTHALVVRRKTTTGARFFSHEGVRARKGKKEVGCSGWRRWASAKGR
jgi:hypothetical protein